jgi:hypothetical protein
LCRNLFAAAITCQLLQKSKQQQHIELHPTYSSCRIDHVLGRDKAHHGEIIAKQCKFGKAIEIGAL